MDGNARWAEQHNTTKSEGHREGMKTAHKIVEAACNMGISYLTLYTFSSENWLRPASEISTIMEFLKHSVTNDIETLYNQGIKLKVVGNLDKLDKDLQYAIKKAEDYTKDNKRMTLALAISYGSREEITMACKKIVTSFIEEKKSLDEIEKIDEALVAHNLYEPEMPDVDLLIRPSGCYRISNFLLWQSAYAELLFIDKFWPDFNQDDIAEAIAVFASRKRSFGKRLDEAR